MKRTIGSLIMDLREENNISQKDLCEGLCTVQTLSKLEMGERIPDIFLVDRLLQRLGKSPDLFEVLLSDDEYDAMLERDSIEETIEQGKFEQAEEQLKNYVQNYKDVDSMQQQYYYQIKAILAKSCGDEEVCIDYLKKAVACTVPHFSVHEKKKTLLCVTEIELLLMLSEQYFTVQKTAEAEELLDYLVAYIEENYTDEIEKAKIYPKAVYLHVKRIRRAGEKTLCLDRCREAFDCLIKVVSTVFLGEIMDALINIYREMHLEKMTVRFEKQLNSLKEVYAEAQLPFYVSERRCGWFKERLRRGYYLCSEMIYGQRMAKGMSREELIAGIYETPESLARVETGKQMPGHKTLDRLMEKLDMHIGRYNGYLVTENYDALEQMKKINSLLSKRECEDAKIELEKLREMLDRENPINKQYIASKDASLDYELNLIDVEEFSRRTLESLELTYMISRDAYCRIPMREEAIIISQLAISLWEQGNTKEGIALFEKMDNCFEKGRIRPAHRFQGRSIMIKNRIRMLIIAGEMELAERLCENAMIEELMAGCGGGLDVYLTYRVSIWRETEENEEKKKKAREKYLRQAFYISDLFRNKENNRLCDAYYRKNISEEINWYC